MSPNNLQACGINISFTKHLWADQKREASFNIRIPKTERALLALEAGAPLGAYIKAKALGRFCRKLWPS